MTVPGLKKYTGFAILREMDKEKLRRIARKGGRANARKRKARLASRRKKS